VVVLVALSTVGLGETEAGALLVSLSGPLLGLVKVVGRTEADEELVEEEELLVEELGQELLLSASSSWFRLRR